MKTFNLYRRLVIYIHDPTWKECLITGGMVQKADKN